MARARPHGPALVRWAVVLAVIASLGSLGIGFIARQKLLDDRITEALEDNATNAQALAGFTDRTAGDHSMELAFEATLKMWRSISRDLPDSDLWVASPAGIITFHSSASENVGKHVRDTVLACEGDEAGALAIERAFAGQSWSGACEDAEDRPILIALEPLSSELGTIMAVSIRRDTVVADLLADAVPWQAGIAFISLVIIPMSVTMLAGAYLRMRRERDYADEHLRETVQMVPGVVYRLEESPEGNRRYTFVSEQSRALSGLAPAEVMADRERVLDRVHPDDQDRVQRSIAALVNVNEEWSCEFRFLRPDGSVSYMHGRSTPSTTSRSTGLRIWHGILLDVSSQRRAESELHTAKHSMDKSGDSIFWIERGGRFVYVNDTACRLLDRTRDELLTMHVWDINPEYDAELWPARVEKIKRERTLTFETRHERRDGHQYPVEITTNLLEHDGEMLICSIARDLTERNARNRELRLARAALESDPDAAYWVRPDGSFSYVNVRAAEALGYTPDELLAMSVSDIDPDFPAERWPEFWQEFQSDPHAKFESRHQRKDGMEFSVEITASLLEFEGEHIICAYARDITDRKTAEARQRASDQHLRNVVEGANVILWEFSIESKRFTYVSGQAEHILGYPEEEWFAKGFWTTHMHPEDLTWAPAYCIEKSQELEDHSFEYRMIAADGRTIWLRDLVSVVAREGQPVALRGALVDITHQREAEERVRESEQRLRELATHLPGVVYSYDYTIGSTRRLIYLGPGFDELIGPEAAREVEEQFDLFFERMHPADRRRLDEAVTASREDGGPIDLEFRVRGDDGKWRWLRSVARGLRVDDETERWHVVLQDISDRRAAEDALSVSEERYRTIIEQQSEFLCRFLPDFTHSFVNGAYCRYHQKQPQEMIGTSFLPAIPAEDQEICLRAIDSISIDNPEITVQHRVTLPSGEVRWNEWVNRGIFGGDGTLVEYQATGRDVTDLRRARAQLERSNQTLQLLLSELDHRVKNSMSGLLSLIDLSRRQSESVDGYADSIRRRVETMSGTHAMLSAGHWRPVDLETLIMQMAPADVPGAIELEGPSIDIPPRQVTAMGMVVNELIGNSLKHGALSRPAGVVSLVWKTQDLDNGVKLELRWVERGGPRIESNPEPRLGSQLINGFASAELRGFARLDYPASGAAHEFEFWLDHHGREDPASTLAHEIKPWHDAETYAGRQ